MLAVVSIWPIQPGIGDVGVPFWMLMLVLEPIFALTRTQHEYDPGLAGALTGMLMFCGWVVIVWGRRIWGEAAVARLKKAAVRTNAWRRTLIVVPDLS
jgi:hypothetical protein